MFWKEFESVLCNWAESILSLKHRLDRDSLLDICSGSVVESKCFGTRNENLNSDLLTEAESVDFSDWFVLGLLTIAVIVVLMNAEFAEPDEEDLIAFQENSEVTIIEQVSECVVFLVIWLSIDLGIWWATEEDLLLFQEDSVVADFVIVSEFSWLKKSSFGEVDFFEIIKKLTWY